jgi:hypothetical protein
MSRSSVLLSLLKGPVMYQPYPGGAGAPEPSGPSGTASLPAPTSITRAVRVMYAGAVASLIGIGVDFIGIGGLKTRLANANHKLTPTQLTSAEHVAIAFFIIGGLIGVALWIWMARVNGAGKSWGRVVATVFFAIDTISQFVGLGGGLSGVGRIWSLVIWLIGLAAIILLWQRTSSEYFGSAQRS